MMLPSVWITKRKKRSRSLHVVWSPGLKPMHTRIVLVYTRINPITKHTFLSFVAIVNLALHLFLLSITIDTNICRPRE